MKNGGEDERWLFGTGLDGVQWQRIAALGMQQWCGTRAGRCGPQRESWPWKDSHSGPEVTIVDTLSDQPVVERSIDTVELQAVQRGTQY